ncbi:MAG: PilZ domain-containing protein [Candidatus Omnitrophota bacterium]
MPGRPDKGKNMSKKPTEGSPERKRMEKRKYPRLKDENISLKVKSGDIDIITKSLDISASGVYCKIEKEVPLMSRIKVVLIVPKPKTDKEPAPRAAKIETDGVVVREHPVIVDGKIAHYDIAIFFDNISAKDREALFEYTNQRARNK